MKSAMTTAAGVAGGMLVAGAIGNMMKGHGEGGTHNTSGDGSLGSQPYQDANSNDQGGTYTQSTEPTYQDANSNDQGGNYAPTTETAYQDASNNDQGTGGTEDAGFDDGGSDWGSGGGDIET